VLGFAVGSGEGTQDAHPCVRWPTTYHRPDGGDARAVMEQSGMCRLRRQALSQIQHFEMPIVIKVGARLRQFRQGRPGMQTTGSGPVHTRAKGRIKVIVKNDRGENSPLLVRLTPDIFWPSSNRKSRIFPRSFFNYDLDPSLGRVMNRTTSAVVCIPGRPGGIVANARPPL